MSRKYSLLYIYSLEDIVIQHLLIPNNALWIGDISDSILNKNSNLIVYGHKQASLLLGQSFNFIIWNGLNDFDITSLAQVLGSLIDNGVILIILNKNRDFIDYNSISWNGKAINTQKFNEYLDLAIDIYLCKQTSLKDINCLVVNNSLPTVNTSNDNISLNNSQQEAIKGILQDQKRVNVLLDKRGRGKTTSLSFIALYLSREGNNVVLVSKSKSSSFSIPDTKLVSYASIDNLLINLACTTNNQKIYQLSNTVLIIDEAAQLSLDLIYQLISYPFKRIIISTTIDGYEGTAQGFNIKLLQQIDCSIYYLNDPIRWSKNDDLELFIDYLLMNNVDYKSIIESNKQQVMSKKEISNMDILLKYRNLDIFDITNFFCLMRESHYKTKIDDLRRLFDADGSFAYIMYQLDQYGDKNAIGGIWYLHEKFQQQESNFSQLKDDIVKGNRRPRGNIVLQRLACLIAEPDLLDLNCLRVSRIFIKKKFRGHKLSDKLLDAPLPIDELDFISISYAQNDKLDIYWKNQGYTLVYISNNKQSFSGNSSVIGIKPISKIAGYYSDLLLKQQATNKRILEIINIGSLDSIEDLIVALYSKDISELHNKELLNINKLSKTDHKLINYYSKYNLAFYFASFSIYRLLYTIIIKYDNRDVIISRLKSINLLNKSLKRTELRNFVLSLYSSIKPNK